MLIKLSCKNKTFRLNITVCKPYNADFDGDEMNMHVPQSIQCVEELKRLSLVSKQIISPGNSTPILSIVQDSLIGGYLLTKEENRFYKKDIYNLMMSNTNFDGNIPEPIGVDENGNEYWDGKQLFSTILPKITISTKLFKDNYLKVNKGKMEEGYLESKFR